MAIDTFFVFTGVYPDTESAVADYDAVKVLHTEVDLIDAYDAAVIERRADGKVKIVKKHETPTRVVGISDMEAKIRAAMKKASKVEEKQLKADNAKIEADAKADS